LLFGRRVVLFIRDFTVRKHERGILLRNGDFQRFLVSENKENLRAHLNASFRFRVAQLAVKNARIPWIFSTRRSSTRITL
jgi:hypothetical protein